jgi:aminoglycoside phosphotransferase (APT) family kinase protein
VNELRRDPMPLSDALRATPQTFLHGDWKLGNVGSAPDGRTVLLDWAYPGEGPACHELTWYLALNRSRLPVGHDKVTTIDAFRTALERHGIDTTTWWEVQLDLCMLGALVQFGWEKALGEEDELRWWCDAAARGAERL